MSTDLSFVSRATGRRYRALAPFAALAFVALGGCGDDGPGSGDTSGSECTTNFDCPNPFDDQCVAGVCVSADVGGEDVIDDTDAGNDVGTDPDVEVIEDVVDEETSDVPDDSGDADVFPDVTDEEVADIDPNLDTGPVCGNGIEEEGEQCDDGNTDSGDGCDRECNLEPTCGDGTVDVGEECDDGNNDDGDGCNFECDLEPFCGDGDLDFGEECDDGNDVDEDGCSSDCLIEDEFVPPDPVNNPYIAFITRPLGLEQISLITASGGERTSVDTGDVIQYDPAWSPDGTRIAFRAIGTAESPEPPLRIVDVTTGEVETYEPGLYRFAFPTWSPDGNRIAFEGRVDADSNADIYIMNLDDPDADLIQVTDTPHSEAAPQWVRRNVLYYVSNSGSEYFDVYRHDMSTDTVTSVTDSPGVLGSARVSWDERYLLFRQRTGLESGELVLYDTETTLEYVVGSERASDPAMSPDGAWFAFVERTDGQADIVLMDLLERVTVGQPTNDADVELALSIGTVESRDLTIDLGD